MPGITQDQLIGEENLGCRENDVTKVSAVLKGECAIGLYISGGPTCCSGWWQLEGPTPSII